MLFLHDHTVKPLRAILPFIVVREKLECGHMRKTLIQDNKIFLSSNFHAGLQSLQTHICDAVLLVKSMFIFDIFHRFC